MEKIISNIKKHKNTKKNINDEIITTIELELNYKIECEKTKQLQLIKDIRKIEKNIKEKELYNKRKNNINLKKKINLNNSNSDYSDTDSTDSDSTNSENSINLCDKDNDSISLCSYNSYYSYNEIEIIS
jgi:hypothetical protein